MNSLFRLGFDEDDDSDDLSASEPEDEADEDSNNENDPRNDYPEDEDADEDMRGYRDAFAWSDGDEDKSSGAYSDEDERGAWDYR